MIDPEICAKTQEGISRLVSGITMSPDKVKEIKEHAEGCAACGAFFQEQTVDRHINLVRKDEITIYPDKH